jgi:CheY-like chemotaxis protein
MLNSPLSPVPAGALPAAPPELPLQAYVGAAREPIAVTDELGVVTLANAPLLGLLRHPAEALLGRTLRELLPALRGDPSDPAGAAERRTLVSLTRADGKSCELELRRVPLSHQARPAGAIWFFHDVTEQRRIQASLYRGSLQSESLLETARLLNDAHSLRAVCEAVFRRLAELVRYDEGLLLMPPDDAGALGAGYRFLSLTGEADETGWRGGNPALRALFIEACPVSQCAADGALIAVPVICEDEVSAGLCLTRGGAAPFTDEDRLCLETAAVQLAAALASEKIHAQLSSTRARMQLLQQAAQSREPLQALGIMAGGVVRDINSALLPVLGFTELLLGQPADADKAAHYLRLIHAGASDAAAILARLTDFYRHTPGGGARQRFDLNALIRGVVEMTRPKWESLALAAGVEIRTRMNLGEIPRVAGYPGELMFALVDLIIDAVDGLDRAGGVISFRTRADQDQVMIEISCSAIGAARGAGTPQPFAPAAGGVPRALDSIYSAIEKHGGTMDRESDGAQTVITMIALPVPAADDAPAAPPPEAPAATAAAPSVRGLKVLVADDEPMVREMISDSLTSAGHIVMSAVNGADALARFKPGYYDLVITDRSMPGLNGDKLAAELKARDPQLPVIMLTGFGELMLAAGEKPEGVDRVIGKPVGVRRLRELVASVAPRARPVPAS